MVSRVPSEASGVETALKLLDDLAG